MYEHPTLEDLAATISKLVNDASPQAATTFEARVDEMKALIAKDTHGLPPPRTRIVDQPLGPPVVLLTGSTGNIGSHILASLLSESRITRVYTLDRPSPDPKLRLKTAFIDRNLPLDLLDYQKLVCLTGDVGKTRFDVHEVQYNEVSSEVHLFASELGFTQSSSSWPQSPTLSIMPGP